ncbi:MAG: BMP family ABC transporter substrate-binding protein [Bifidobacteriaceae bacterium]|jgi:basic membrane protein A|nr:BMP family ABC transporter substrate-binding protein [Bifidobacteriaceae bacterium]
MKKLLTAMGAFALSLALVGCGGTPNPDESGSPEPTDSGSPEAAGLYCVISDGGTFEDKAFNQSALLGAEQAKNELGVEIKPLESTKAEDYEPNITSAVNEGCNLIITVGFNLAEATKIAAEANPNVDFAIIDDNSITSSNVKPIMFDVAQAAYLGGYLAAGFSKSGIVAAYGGMAIPPVQLYFDGGYQGIQAYNKAKNADVKFLGWDPENPSDMMAVGDFTDAAKAKVIAETFINQGADIIIGSVGGGTQQAVAEHNAYYMLGDVDAYYTDEASYLPHLLSSMLKNIQPAVFQVIKDHKEGNFNNTPYIGTLANGGVGLAPYHDLEGEVSDELKAEIQKLNDDIVAGTIQVTSQFSPTA